MANVLESVGEKTIEHLDYVGSLNIQWWATLRAMLQSLPLVGNRYRWRAAVRQMLEIGVDAMPMVSLMSICTGFIFAMQGASELRRFGALRYVVDLVAVGFTRELGPLMPRLALCRGPSCTTGISFLTSNTATIVHPSGLLATL
jgi:phospholipid/cholesterol/gamma-HCH transport system permease protein